MFTSSSPRTSVHTNASDLHQSAPHALSNGNGAEQSVSNRKSIGGASDAAELAYDGIEDEAPAGSAERRLASEEQPYLPSSSTKEQVALQQQFRKDLEEQHAREEQEREEALRQRREAAALISIQRAQAEEAAAEMLRQTQKEAALKQEIEAEDRRKAIEEDALQEAEKTKSDRAAAEQEASARAQQERDEAARRAAQEEQALKDQEAARRMETKENARRDVALRIQQAASDEQVILTGFVSIQGGSSVVSGSHTAEIRGTRAEQHDDSVDLAAKILSPDCIYPYSVQVCRRCDPSCRYCRIIQQGQADRFLG